MRGFNRGLHSGQRRGLVCRFGCRQRGWQDRWLRRWHWKGHSSWLWSGRNAGVLRWERRRPDGGHRSRHERGVVALQLYSDVICLLRGTCCARQVQSQVVILDCSLELTVDVIFELRSCRIVRVLQILAHVKRHVSSHAAIVGGLPVRHDEIEQVGGVDVLDRLRHRLEDDRCRDVLLVGSLHTESDSSGDQGRGGGQWRWQVRRCNRRVPGRRKRRWSTGRSCRWLLSRRLRGR